MQRFAFSGPGEFPQYNTITEGVASYGNSIYHSLQVFVQKRMSHGYGFTAAYTNGKQISDTRGLSTGVGYQNAYDRRAERETLIRTATAGSIRMRFRSPQTGLEIQGVI